MTNGLMLRRRQAEGLPRPLPRGCRRRPSSTVEVLLRLTICLVILPGYGHVYSEDADGEPRAVAGVAAESCSDRANCIEGAVRGTVAFILVGDDTKHGDVGTPPQSADAEGDEATDLIGDGTGAAIDGTGRTVGTIGSCDGRRFKKCR